MNGTRPDRAKLYYPKMTASWWLKKPAYFLFMLRELSSLFIAIYLIVFLIQLYQLRNGADAYIAFARKLSSPGWLVFHLVALLFALYHSVTWFKSSAVVLPIKLGRRELSRNTVLMLNVTALVVISVGVAAFFIGLQG